MNERIRELKYQAEALAYEEHKANCIKNGIDPSMPHANALNMTFEKFAQLIVKECAKFCDEIIKEAEIAMAQCEMVKTSDRLMMLHDGTINGAQMSKIRFKKHFGVEE